MHLVAEDDAQEASRGTRLATCPLTKSALGSSMRSGLDPRFEKTQNLVSTKVPEVIESLRASCNGNGIVMAKVATFTVCELYEALDIIHVVWARLVVFSVYSTSGASSARDMGMHRQTHIQVGDLKHTVKGRDRGAFPVRHSHPGATPKKKKGRDRDILRSGPEL
jgi:hypothetical protein